MSSPPTQFISVSQDTYKIPVRLFRDNRSKLANELLLLSSSKGEAAASKTPAADDAILTYHVVLKGGRSPLRYDTDHEPVFRQESYFWWLSGVKEPDCSIVLTIKKKKEEGRNVRTTLFVPNLPPSYATIMGRIRTLSEWKDIYGVDDVQYTDQLESFLKTSIKETGSDGVGDGTAPGGSSSSKILLMKGPNTDSGSMYEPPVLFAAAEGESDGDTNGDDDKSRGNIKDLIDDEILFPVLAECRVIKSDDELRLLEHVSQVSSFAHGYVMRNVAGSTVNKATGAVASPVNYEYQCESLFRHYSYFNYGCRLVSYTSICGCGPNSAILHYGHAGEPNSRKIDYVDPHQDHVLFDMGAEYMCYASDITCSFPVSGKFTQKYRSIYESVLNAQRAVIAMMRPGVSWVDCHKKAEMEILKGLYRVGVVRIPSTSSSSSSSSNLIDGERERKRPRQEKGDDGNMPLDEKKTSASVEDVANADDNSYDDENDIDVTSVLQDLNERHRFGAVFMPHGLGHFLGIDTHDVGGYLPGHPERSPLPGLKSLRTSRVLQEKMVLTVEPGCYFIDHLLDEALEHPVLSKYLNRNLINTEYRGYGGVRLEDVVTVVSPETTTSPNGTTDVVPGSGCINFTLCPRTVAEVEHVMSGGKWPPTKDDAPELRRVKLTSPISPLPPPPSH